MRLSAIVLVFVVGVALAEKPEPAKKDGPTAREIDAKGLKLAGKVTGGVKSPTKVTSKEDLEKLFDKDSSAALLKKVDFKNEYLLVFAWAGSGGDKLSFKVETTKKGDEVVYSLQRGRTRDLRQHMKVYAVPAKATYKIGK